MRFLSYCLDLLFPPRASERLVHDAMGETIATYYEPTTHRIGPYPCTTLLSYEHPLVRALILEAKFKGNIRAHALLGKMLHTFLAKHPPIIIVPVPLSSKRRRARGMNQVEEILRHTAASHPIRHLLTRVRNTAPQTELAAEARQHNVIGAFSASGVDPSTTYLIIDDVTTTGATLQDAARALSAAGALHIHLLALARA